MKTTIVITVLLLVPVLLSAQSKSIEAFYKKYENDRDATVVNINGSLFSIFAKLGEYAEEEDKELRSMGKLAANIQSMKILSLPIYKVGIEQSEINQLKSNLIAENYEELFSAREGRKTINCYSQGNKSEIKNIVILVNKKDDFTIMNLNGNLNMKDLAVLAKNFKHFR